MNQTDQPVLAYANQNQVKTIFFSAFAERPFYHDNRVLDFEKLTKQYNEVSFSASKWSC